ncbi:DUF4864 domain-containing protein [Marinobacter changyiensis]|uniref:DUF4864 domain-containing protein n=1 Tax=Marinobacter changyiensis TaxID=2604091 RepID=UPI001FEAF032|nr:DUF4864 domain-containing protein [Marinobacter changyiensis]
MLVIFGCLLGTGVGLAESSNETAGSEIREVIIAQIVAFASDDAEAAWQYASEDIQQQFSSPDAFMGMVGSRYPAVYRAGSIEFLSLVPHPGFMIQTLRIKGPDGRFWDSAYTLTDTDEGWRIGGVVVKEAESGI